MIQGFHGDDYESASLAINVFLKSDVQIGADAVEFFRRTHGVISQFVHVALNEAIVGVGRENPIHEALVTRLTSAASPTIAAHLWSSSSAEKVANSQGTLFLLGRHTEKVAVLTIELRGG